MMWRGYAAEVNKCVYKRMNIDGLSIFCCLRNRDRAEQVQLSDESPDVVLDKHFIGNVSFYFQ